MSYGEIPQRAEHWGIVGMDEGAGAGLIVRERRFGGGGIYGSGRV